MICNEETLQTYLAQLLEKAISPVGGPYGVIIVNKELTVRPMAHITKTKKVYIQFTNQETLKGCMTSKWAYIGRTLAFLLAEGEFSIEVPQERNEPHD